MTWHWLIMNLLEEYYKTYKTLPTKCFDHLRDINKWLEHIENVKDFLEEVEHFQDYRTDRDDLL